jgi:hypothetical protein
MKKMNWLYFVIAIVVMIGCTKSKVETPPDPAPGPNLLTVDTPRTAISLAQLVLDTLIEGPTLLDEAKAGNLKKLWKYDENLYKVSNSSRKFIVTKEINPCCPCSSTEPMCCACLIDTDFAATTGTDGMNATLSLSGTDITPDRSVSGVDLFSIPSDTQDGTYELIISGPAFPKVTYSVTISARTISFNRPR